MSVKTDQLLVVVSILEGRHFPKNPRLSLVVQVSFDGEQLATDPAEHREQPQFNTELAWELDRRTLHQHRLQRTPIKLQCFAVDSVIKKRESVGYIVLDLRSAQEVKQEPRWFPLLSSKYVKQRSALLLAVSLENDSKPSKSSPDRFKARKAPPRNGSSPAVTDLLPDKLEAVLVPDKGYHQVGAADLCSDMFVLSVTVAFATKLEQLIPSSMTLSSEGSDFFFYYCLLGSDITSEPFGSLLSPDFQPERASVRLRSSRAVLQAFLSQQPSLQIHLCCGSYSLGSAEVSLLPLAAAPSDLDTKAVTVEGAFVLRPPDRNREQLAALSADQQPSLGVSVTLRREELAPESAETKEGCSVTAPAPPLSPPPCLQKPPSCPPPPSSHTESEVESLLEERQLGREQAGPADPDVPAQLPGEQPEAAAASTVSVPAPKVSIPSSAHHFCFSLDLCSLRGLSLVQPIAATLRYSYRFFGSVSPIMTNPPVELRRNSEIFLPQSFYAFDFAALPHQLHDTFLRVPLLVELWHRDASSGDQLMGRASIPLSGLLSPDRTWTRTQSTGEQEVVPVLSPSQMVAELRYTATLQDLGLVKATEVILSHSSQEAPAHTQPPPPPPTSPPHGALQGPAAPAVPAAAPREILEYQAALELELWKEEQESQFDDQLRKKELSHMQALAEEWRKRDREREAVMKKKEVEYGLLEERLQKTLCVLERREKLLAEAELESRRLQRELQAEHQLSQRELQDSSRRLQQQCDHRVALERDKVRLMEEERGRLLQQIANVECRYKQLEKEFHQYREQQSSRPEVRLQADINLLTLEKVELERKLESTTKSKLHYKQQWGRALKELARFKQREQEEAVLRLKKQQEELEAMRLRYLAAEEKEVVRQDQQELDSVRNQLNRLKQQEERSASAPSVPGPAPSVHDPAPSVHDPAPSPCLTESAEEHLSRLLEERDTLLRTGVYTHEDWIISELSRQIQDAIRDRKQL